MSQPIVGIVAEYNPFHWGHQYQLNEAKKKANADAVVVVLSSNIVQRGVPAFLDKKNRVYSALYGGADLILELPAVFSAHNAGVFASAAIDILAATGIVTHVSFGMETPADISKIVSILNQEPLSFKNSLKEELGKGFSFVEARCRAVEALIPGSAPILSEPNNSLALAYAMRIQKQGYPLELLPIARIGAGYHDNQKHVVSSATAVRALSEGGNLEEALQLVPHFAAAQIRVAAREGTLFASQDLYWLILQSALLRAGQERVSHVAEMREGLENLLLRSAKKATSLNAFVDLCTSKRYTKGRILRHCMHFLLALDHWSNRAAQRLGPPYIRILGATESGRELIRKMKETATLPIISRASAPFSPYAQQIMHFEHMATQIRDLSTPARRLDMEKKFVPSMRA